MSFSTAFPTQHLLPEVFTLDYSPDALESLELFTSDLSINVTELPNATAASGSSALPRCTYKEDFKQILLPAVYSFVFVLGLPLNAAVIQKIWRKRPNLSRNNIYTLNLAIADLLYVMSLPLLIYNYGSHDYWPFGEFACKFVRFQFYSNLHGSILFLTCISEQRYVGKCHPMALWHKRGGRKLAWRVCGGVWLVVALLCAPTFHFAATGIQRNRTVCYDLSTPKQSVNYYPYGMALTFLGFVLPFLGIMACYCRMGHFLCRPVEYHGVSIATSEKRDKAVRMIVVVATVFCISFLPFHLTKTLYLLVRTFPRAPCEMRNLFSVVYKCTRPFASMNSFLDPILFYFTQPRYRESTKRFVLKVTTLRDKGTSV